MCKPWPGPRCADHTHQAWIKSTAALKNAKTALEEAQDAFDKARGAEAPIARAALNKARRAYDRAADRHDRSREEWESTPEGQQKLRDMITIAENAGRDERAQSLRERLENAERLRSEHMAAHRAIQSGNKAYDKLPLTEQATFNERSKKVQAQGAEVAAAAKDVKAALTEVRNAEREVERETRKLRARLRPVQAAHDAVVRAAYTEYVNHGVPADRARHYALDTANSMQTGWHYLTEDSSDRAPLYGDDPTPKVKGEGHEDHEATQRAEWGMQHSNDYRAAVAASRGAHSQYEEGIEPLKEKKERLKTLRENFEAKASAFEEKKTAYETARATLNHDIAARVGFSEEIQTYRVQPANFVRSAYRNPDGSTNAYVLTTLGKKKQPRYIPVRDTGSDDAGAYVTLTTGEKIYSSEVLSGSRSLLLTPPAEGATRFFSTR